MQLEPADQLKGPGEIGPRRHIEHATPGGLDGGDGLLDRVGVERLAVGDRAKIGEVYRVLFDLWLVDSEAFGQLGLGVNVGDEYHGDEKSERSEMSDSGHISDLYVFFKRDMGLRPVSVALPTRCSCRS